MTLVLFLKHAWCIRMFLKHACFTHKTRTVTCMFLKHACFTHKTRTVTCMYMKPVRNRITTCHYHACFSQHACLYMKTCMLHAHFSSYKLIQRHADQTILVLHSKSFAKIIHVPDHNLQLMHYISAPSLLSMICGWLNEYVYVHIWFYYIICVGRMW